MKSDKGFKILAVRVTKGCEPYIRKCLHEGVFYYLCHDYTISENGKTIFQRSCYIQPLHDDFFTTNDVQPDTVENGNSLRFNVSAIVGMNGDGKSSLIELILRILNNQIGSRSRHQLMTIKGVCAELYIFYNGEPYVIQCQKHGVLTYQYHLTEEGVYQQTEEAVACPNFYTMVSNYSLYAYNELDYYEEWSSGVKYKDDSKCWLHHIFHKNDGYQAPLSLHPFRQQGNIDINRERELSIQRLLTVILRAEEDANNPFKNVNGKRACSLYLKRVDESKLLKRTEYVLSELGHIRLLDKYIDAFQKPSEKTLIDKEEQLVKDFSRRVTEFYTIYLAPNSKVYHAALQWAKKKKLLSKRSDLSELIDLLKKRVRWPEDMLKELNELKDFSLAQIQLLYYVIEVNNIWANGLTLGSTLKKVESSVDLVACFSKEEKTEQEACMEYILYKTLNIFSTYDIYQHPQMHWVDVDHMLSKETTGLIGKEGQLQNAREVLKNAFGVLAEDWRQHSHITLKLRQTYNYLQHLQENPMYMYNNPDVLDSDSDEKKDGIRRINIDKLNKKYPSIRKSLDLMPPRIFTWDIQYQKGTEKVALSKFSSGEKQRLYSMSAIVYHLLNIDSISKQKGNTKYRAVNLMFEEIELYFHPEWQRTLVNELMNSIRSFHYNSLQAVNVLFVTHSPFILSDIPKTNVLFLQEGVPVEKMQENTFGANVNSLLKNGFFLPSLPMGEFAYQKINNLFAKLHSGEFAKESLESMYQEIMQVGEPFIRKQLLSLYNMYAKK